MNEFSVDIQKLESLSKDFKGVSSKVNVIMNKADETMDICKKSFLGKLADNIQDAILLSGMKNNIKDFNNLSSGIDEAVDIYKRYEKRVEQYSFRNDPEIVKYIDDGGEGFMEYNYYSVFSSERNIYTDALLIIGGNLTDISYYTGDYGKKIIYNSLYSILGSLCDSEIDLSIYELPEDLIKGALDGKDFIEKLTNSEVFPQYKNQIKLIEKYAKGLDWAQFSAEEVAFILKDFSANMAYIEALENTLSFSGEGNEDLTAAINKLKKDYTQKYTKVLSDTAEKVIEGAWDSAVDISTGGIFSVVQFVTSTGYMLTGADDKAENLEMLSAINLYKRDLNRAYEVKAEQIRSGNYTEEDVREAERLYNLSKATTEREYEIMLELSKDKDDKKKIEKELDEIRSKPSFSL